MDGAAFMNSLHNTASFIYSAMKADAIGNAAVESLRNGRAPVITLYNTNQSLLEAIGEQRSGCWPLFNTSWRQSNHACHTER